MRKKIKKLSNIIAWRFILLYIFITTSIIILFLRMSFLHIFDAKKLILKSNTRTLRVQDISIPRGEIKDRFGKVLAFNIPTYSIWIDPQELNKYENIFSDKRWIALSDILSIPYTGLIKKIKNKNKRFFYLARHININIFTYIKKLNIPGLHFEQELKRYYPNANVTAHVIGFTDIDNQGVEGIEKNFNHQLKGTAGKRLVRKNIYGDIIENRLLEKEKKSNDVILSINKKLQDFAYYQLSHAIFSNKAESGTIILSDIHTGEILVMVNNPSYNPNNLTNVSKDFIRNRAITDIFEPGSTVKPMVIMAALKCGLVKKNTVINTVPFKINNHKITDVVEYHSLTIPQILYKSSNVGVSKLALAMPSSELINTYALFGLGKKTQVGLIGENIGIYPKKFQSNLDKAAFSFGYGLMVTPMQLVRAYAAIGSYGIIRPLSITKIHVPIPGQRIFPEKIVKSVVEMMEGVSKSGNVGEKASIPGYRIAIKTGTVKKLGMHGKYIDKYLAYTVGIAPVSNPRFCLLIMIDNPQAGKYYGGSVSAPLFSFIMEKVLHTMQIKPDNIKKII